MNQQFKTQLEAMYHFEKTRKNDPWLHQPTGGGAVEHFTFGQAMEQARRMATYLRAQGLPEGSHVAIFSKNTAWWMMADLAIWMAGYVSIPLYPTLTPETIRQILEHSDSKFIFVGKLDGFELMKPGVPEDLPGVAMPLCPAGLDYPAWSELLSANEPLESDRVPDPGELATMIYTSGSTGVPKGVMHSFETMSRSAFGVSNHLGMEPRDRMLSYLPLAHSFERWIVETVTFCVGFQVFFAESLDTFVSDLTRARPTLFVSVPRLWQKFQLGVFQKMKPAKLELFLKIPILRGIVRKKVLSGLGLDQVRFAGSGSAPIPGELIEWYRALGLELLEGYGMSENFAYSHCSNPGEVRVGYVGSPYPDVVCKLSEEGEILVKSPGTMLGYYKNEAQTTEMMTDDGFLRTGDRGEIDSANRLRITGRTKELFKTSKGKYVAPAPIENKLQLHHDVEVACVSGSGQSMPYGILVLSEQTRGQASARKSELVSSIGAHLDAVNKELDHHEHLKFVTVVADEWSIENGMLTPTMKMKRAAVEDRYGDRVEGWYGAGEKVVWA